MALQQLCLTKIVESFERYSTAFFTSKDANFKRKFEFLQRVYSLTVLSGVYERWGIKEKYTDLLINKHLEFLNTDWFNNCPWKTVIAKLAEVGPNIKKIYFKKCDRPWQEIFCYLPNLEVMHFDGECKDEILSALAKFCPNILEIDVSFSPCITKKGLKSLCKKKNGKVSCPKLKKLLLEFWEIAEEVVKCLLEGLPSLEVFDYRNLPVVLYSMHKQNLSKHDKVQPYKLSELDLFSSSRKPYFTELLKVCLSLCPFVTSLKGCVLEPQHLDLLSGFTHLEILDLKCDLTEYIDINNFLKSKGNKLTYLTICKCSLSVLTLAESCPALKMLSMNNVSFKQHDGSIPSFQNLDALTVSETEIYSNATNLTAVCLILSSSPKLKSLTLERCNLTSNQVKMEILKYCEQNFVMEIDFSYSSVDKQFVKDILLTCQSLEFFNLKDCSLENNDEYEIRRCTEGLPNLLLVFYKEEPRDFDYSDMDVDDSEDYEDEYDEPLCDCCSSD